MTLSKTMPRRAALVAALALIAGLGAGAPRVLAQDSGPRLGAYTIYQVVLTSRSVSGYMALKENGVYELYYPDRSPRGRGTYRYDAAQKRVFWLSGVNYDMGRGGTFTAEQGGKVHRILWGPKAYAINGE